MDEFDAPTCTDCGTVLHPDGADLVCRGCRMRMVFPTAAMPAEFDGASLPGW